MPGALGSLDLVGRTARTREHATAQQSSGCDPFASCQWLGKSPLYDAIPQDNHIYSYAGNPTTLGSGGSPSCIAGDYDAGVASPPSPAIPASATAWSSSTVEPETPIAPIIVPSAVTSGIPPGNVISPSLETSAP